MLARSMWGNGYATEAGRAIRDDAFEQLDRESVIAVHHPANTASRRIIEKLGLTFEWDIGSEESPLPLYRLTREDWAIALDREPVRLRDDRISERTSRSGKLARILPTEIRTLDDR